MDLVAEDQQCGQGLVGHGVVVLGVLRREGGEGTEHRVLLQSIITLLPRYMCCVIVLYLQPVKMKLFTHSH